MSWADGRRAFENGVSRAVVYYRDGSWDTWVGLLSVRQAPDVESSSVYFEGGLASTSQTPDILSVEVEGYTYPQALLDKPVRAFSYVVNHGEHEKIHMFYNPTFTLGGVEYATYSTDTEPSTFSLKAALIPELIPGYAPSSHLFIETALDDGYVGLPVILDLLYGTTNTDPAYLPPSTLIGLAVDPNYGNLSVTIRANGTILYSGGPVVVSDNGTFTVSHSRVRLAGDGQFVVNNAIGG